MNGSAEKKTVEFPILVQEVSKTYGGTHRAVDGISLQVRCGEIFGFLGPNGAGKTTTIKMLAGLLRPDQGSVIINGNDLAADPVRCKRDTGYIPDRPFLYEKLTGGEFLHFMASLYQLDSARFEINVARLLAMFDLKGWQRHLIESYSHGMRQKLIMTAAFMLDPPVLIVDEPMVGLDPRSARIVKELFKDYAGRGGTVFLSTHSLEVAEELCDRIAILLNGRIRASGDMGALRREAGMEGSDLEEVFLELTGAYELHQVIAALRGHSFSPGKEQES